MKEINLWNYFLISFQKLSLSKGKDVTMCSWGWFKTSQKHTTEIRETAEIKTYFSRVFHFKKQLSI